MKRLLIILFVSGISISAYSQKDIPAFGKVEKADLELKECEFDNAAEAMILFDVGEVYCNFHNNLTSELSRHIRIKIFSDKGLDRANIKIRYYSNGNLEDIRNISAQTINLDASGNIVYTKVEKSLIYRKKINKRYSEVIFTFPEVKKGSIIEYKYVDYADGLYALRNWYFQESIPIKLSRFTLDFPTEFIVTATQKTGLFLDIDEKLKADRNIKTYTMKEIPALRDEAYITCDEDYMEQISPLITGVDLPGRPRINLLRTWPGIVKELMEDEDFGQQLKKNIPRTSDLDLMLAKITDPYRKMVIIYEYVRKNMQWNEYYGIWANDGVKSAWKDKKGTAGEINLILVNLLKDADLSVHPLLVSTRENGRVNTSIAGFSQFNKVMAFVEIDKKQYVLDATDKFTPANLIPYDVLYSEGLAIEKYSTFDWGWKMLWNADKLNKNVTVVMADIDEKGIIKGEANVSSYDYSRLERIPFLKKGKEKFIEKYFTSQSTGFKLDSLDIENENADSLPLNQHASFTGKTNSSGDYQYFSVNVLTGLEKNPFLADNRFSDVFFGCNQKYTIIGNFTIPESCQFDELPKNIKMIMPDTSIIFSRIMQITDNQVSVQIQMEVKKPFYPVVDYPYFKEFYKKVYEMINEQVVFKKK